MKIIAIEKEVPGINDGQFTPAILKSEADRVWGLYQEGTIREMYFRQDRSEAILILECKDMGEARGALSTLPLVKEGLISFEPIPLVAYPGFARLFYEPKGRRR